MVTTTFLPSNKAHKSAGSSAEGSSSEKVEGLTIQDSSNSSIMIAADKLSYEETDLEEGIPILGIRKNGEFVPPMDEILRDDGNRTKHKTLRVKRILRNGEPSIYSTNEPYTNFHEKIIAPGITYGGTLYPRKMKVTSTTISGMAAWPKDMYDAHFRRIKEVGKHMELHYMSTLYLFEEVHRIKRDRVILDELRHMAADLENANYQQVKAHVMKCYKVGRPRDIRPMWTLNTNNLLINTLKDANNDGVV